MMERKSEQNTHYKTECSGITSLPTLSMT